MKTKLIVLLSVIAAIVTGCSQYDDSNLWTKLTGLDDRVTTIEQSIENVNLNIKSVTALANAQANQLSVSSVNQVDNGYQIVFSDSTSIIIYNGADGKDGADGANGKDGKDGNDGFSPYIASDGNWWINGVNTGIKAVGKDGKPGKDGVNGQDGKPGKDGADGQSGQTPHIGSNGNWWIGNEDTGVTAVAEGTPIMSIREYEGTYYWVQIINGNITFLRDDKGNMIPASGDNTIAPIIKIDIEGYWIISYDGGKKFTYMVDVYGNKILGDITKTSVIVNVYQRGDTYVFVLADGQEIFIRNCKCEKDTYDPDIVLPEPIINVYDGKLYITMSGIQYGSDWLTLYGDLNAGKQNAWVSIDGKRYNNLDVTNTSSSTSLATDIIFLVDNSGSMGNEANAIATQIESWTAMLESNGLNVRFGIVGFAETGYINGAINMTTASNIKKYLDRTTGTGRTMGFGGNDASALQTAAKTYGSLGGENGVMALRMADEHFSFRSIANRVYIMFTDEANQTSGKSAYSVEYVKKNWNGNRGVIHVIYSNNQSISTGTYDEKPWLLADYTGGTKTFTNSSFSGVQLVKLDITGSMIHSYLMTCPIESTLQDGKYHNVSIVVQYPDGVKAQKEVKSLLPYVDIRY